MQSIWTNPNKIRKHQRRARDAAARDHRAGLACDCTRHNAKPGSAFDDWYSDHYEHLNNAQRSQAIARANARNITPTGAVSYE